MTSPSIFRAMTLAGLMAASQLVQAFTPVPDKPSDKVTLIEIGNLYEQSTSRLSQKGYVFSANDPAPEDMFMVWRDFSLTESISSDVIPPTKEIVARAVANTGDNLSTVILDFLPGKGQTQLEVGKYQSHMRGLSLDPDAPRLDVSGFGNYFADLGRSDADFEIVELTRGTGGEITSFAANFVLTNVHFPRNPTLYSVSGRFWYNSDALNVISVPEPKTVSLLLAGLSVASWMRTGRSRRAPSANTPS